MKLTQGEKTILFIALNNLQDQGVKGITSILEKYDKVKESLEQEKAAKAINDWLDQTVEEHDMINSLKAKLSLWTDEEVKR